MKQKKQTIVSGLWYYPIKSCKGVQLTSAEICQTGINHDRHWMIVDESGKFISQRTHRSMALINTLITLDSLSFFTPLQAIFIMPINNEGSRVKVRVWDDKFEAIDEGDGVADYFTYYLSKEIPGKYRLVRMLDVSNRPARLGDAKISFTDAYSFLVISEASLYDLNSLMEEKLPMNRFRPNIVIDGCPPYMEDEISSFKIGEVQFIGMTPCIRCPITTTDQLTTDRGKEPLRTLANYRKYNDGKGNKGVIFGRNFNHTGTGTIKVGDILEFD